MLGMAVRSIQMMVDRGDLEAWKTPGGHRRILRESVHRWLKARNQPGAVAPLASAAVRAPKVLLIEDSKHVQNLVTLLVRQHFPQVELHVADEGIAGLAMAGQLRPQVLIINLLLPGIDGLALITSLRSHPQFQGCHLLIVNDLEPQQRAHYQFALEGMRVMDKAALAQELPAQLTTLLAAAP